MCEKRIKKVKKGTHLTRLREARRTQRRQLIASPVSTSDESNSLPPMIISFHPPIDKVAQDRLILELAWKTIALVYKNKIIQQKIIALQKETSEFVASITKNPQNRQQYGTIHGCGQGQVQMQGVMETNLPVKLEPNV